jgi:hypothetical protein
LLKITDLHPASTPGSEYVVLQNQGLITISLKGWALAGDSYLSGDAARSAGETFIFSDDIPIKPYTRVVLFSGEGTDGWYETIDNKTAYLVYWNRPTPVWIDTPYVHLLRPVGSCKVLSPDLPDAVLA